MPIDRDTHLIAELTPAGSAAIVSTTAAVTVIPTIVQRLIGDLFLVTGRSMLPTFPKRCICRKIDKPFEQLKIGDIPGVKTLDPQLAKFQKNIENTDNDYRTLQVKINQMLGKKDTVINGYVHRIIEKTNKGFITKGDGNRDKDTQLLTRETYNGYVIDKVVMDLSGKITGPVLEGIWLLIKNYKPIL